MSQLQDIFFYSLLITASFCDLRTREIPNRLCLLIALTGLPGFEAEKLWGICVALLLLAGACLFGGIGGGDIKLIAATGVVLGLQRCATGVILGLTACIVCYFGMVMIQNIRGGKATNKHLPLVPFLTIGFAAADIFLI